MKSRYAVAALLALAFPLAGCDEPPPTAPDEINIEIHNENTNNNGQGAPAPGTSPSPSAPGAGLTPTEAKVTIIGGDGSKIVPAGAAFTVTFTRFARNAQGVSVEVPGNPSDAIEWTVLGQVEDKEAGGKEDGQNYNRDLKAAAGGGPFAVTARQGSLEATLVGSSR